MACSPDKEVYMFVREPATCTYVVTLYHPSICDQPDLPHYHWSSCNAMNPNKEKDQKVFLAKVIPAVPGMLSLFSWA